MDTHTHTRTRMYMYVYVFIYRYSWARACSSGGRRSSPDCSGDKPESKYMDRKIDILIDR